MRMRETLNEQYREELEGMKQTQRDIQEIKNSTESWQNSLKLKIDFQTLKTGWQLAIVKERSLKHNKEPRNNNSMTAR